MDEFDPRSKSCGSGSGTGPPSRETDTSPEPPSGPRNGKAPSTRLEEQSKALSATISSIDILGGGREDPRETAPRRTDTHVLLEFGQDDACQLRSPFSVVVDASGDILVLDQPEQGKYRVTRFGAAGRFKETVMAVEKGGGPGQLLYPKGIALDSSGNIYVPEAGNNRIQRFSPKGLPLGSVGELGEQPGQFDFPCDVEIDRSGSLYVADTGNCRIQQVTARGIALALFGVGEDGLPDDTEPELDEPLGVALGETGVLYVADTNHHRIVRYDGPGRKTLVFGSQGPEPGQLQGPSDIHVLASGLIYVADRGNTRVQIFDPKGTFLDAFQLGDVEKESSGGGDVAVDDNGYVFICDRSRNLVMKVELLRTSHAPKGEHKS